MDAKQAKAQLAKDGIDYILAQWVDIHGTPRCKGVPASAFDQFVGGISLSPGSGNSGPEKCAAFFSSMSVGRSGS